MPNYNLLKQLHKPDGFWKEQRPVNYYCRDDFHQKEAKTSIGWCRSQKHTTTSTGTTRAKNIQNTGVGTDFRQTQKPAEPWIQMPRRSTNDSQVKQMTHVGDCELRDRNASSTSRAGTQKDEPLAPTWNGLSSDGEIACFGMSKFQ
ncbi:uncharacterized protein LOC119765643 [Culex quinquefasciatus]|uniref:uncharacterized protein LOC119765643 n=1 Tax=Culex quinquefasciatus TaxID=7176 RepID=UPI0018E37996|nr:uncharacterized protein LOC119765643 [Culex quinquefasciatus]